MLLNVSRSILHYIEWSKILMIKCPKAYLWLFDFYSAWKVHGADCSKLLSAELEQVIILR